MLVDILQRGYLPRELPPPFNSVRYGQVLAATPLTALPGIWALAGKVKQPKQLTPGKACVYSHLRTGLRRRSLAICHPAYHFLLACEVVANWNAIVPQLQSPFSATFPTLYPTGRALQGPNPFRDRRTITRRTRQNSRYTLKTDIGRFYSSIYTHSVPWALMGKPQAKGSRGFGAHFANRVDYWLRMGQDQQTVGIPIGPDLSLVVAELILSSSDRDVRQRLPATRGHRYIDDYELAVGTHDEAEEAFAILEQSLAQFELGINHSKTSIGSLPVGLEAAWARTLRNFRFRSAAGSQASDVEEYFEVAFDLHASNKGEHVLQFALSRLRFLPIAATNWRLFEELLLLCPRPEPATLRFALEHLFRLIGAGFQANRAAWEELVNTLLVEHAPRRHSSEVSWALWASINLRLTLGPAAVVALSQCDDPVVAIMSLHASAVGLCSVPLNLNLWAQRMTTQDLYEENWILAYEANIRGWLPSVGGGDHVMADPTFAFLKANGVSFYDIPPPAAPPVPPPPIPAGGGSSTSVP